MTELIVTKYNNIKDKHETGQVVPLAALLGELSCFPETYKAKADQPLVYYGDAVNDAGNRKGRKNLNFNSCSAVTIDYDGKSIESDHIPMSKAAGLFRSHNIKADLFTTSSHTPDKPCWRAILECSKPISNEERLALTARVNAMLGCVLGADSFDKCRGFFAGAIMAASMIQGL